MRATAESTLEPPLALGLDLGTSSTRAFVFDRFGRGLGGMYVSNTWDTTPDGGVEIDAEAIVAHVIAAIDGALAQIGARAAEIATVGIAALWHSLVGVAGDGVAVTPVYAWSDTRATGAAAELRRRLDEEAVHARTGAVFHPSYLPARVL